MRKLVLLSFLLITSVCIYAQWAPKGNQIKTVWAQDVNPANVLPEYPRPIQERLNGKT